MSKFVIYRQELEVAISACIKSAIEYRTTHQVSDLSTEMIQSLVNQYIAPFAGKENRLDVPATEKHDWRRSATELVFRRSLLSIVCREEPQERLTQIFDCLDLALYCSETEVDLLENVVPLNLLEELIEEHTTSECENIFNYIENRRAKITVDMVPGRGKGLILLRLCNKLLRRLSAETNNVFCGRILMFLANSFPLGERSGVNLRGDFNTNMIHYDSEEEVNADPNMTDDQKEFYKLFWSTRVYFSDPPTIFADDNFEKLRKGTDKIVQRFQIIADKEAEILGARKNQGSSLKRSRTESSSLEGSRMEEDPILAEEMLAEINRDYQFTRLLSSRNLLGLELEDSRFRRNVIVQYLILFQYLSGFSESEKEKTKELLAARGTTKQSLIQPNFTLSDEQTEWVDEVKEAMLTLLRSTKPHGNLFTDIILTILAHERHWIIWKASGCPSFEKPTVSMADLEKSWLAKKPKLEAPPTKYRYSHGNHEVSKLYGKPAVPLSQFMRNRPKFATPIQVIDSAIEELNDSMDPSQQRFDYANGALLQASRLIYAKYPSLIRQVYMSKKESYKDMHDKLNDDNEDEQMADDSKPAPKVPDFIVGETITEDFVQAEIEVLTKAKEILLEEIKKEEDASVKKDQ